MRNKQLEVWNDLILIKDDDFFSKWVKDDTNPRWKIWSYDRPLQIIKHVIHTVPVGGTVVDIGANIGLYSSALRMKVGGAGRVYSFEPMIDAFVCLCNNVPEDNVYKFNIAISNEDGLCSMENNWPGNNNLGASYLNKNISGSTIVKTLDSFNLPKCDFIKMDIEGSELSALKGSYNTISTHRPAIFLEMQNGHLTRQGHCIADIYKFMDSLNYIEVNKWGPEVQYDSLFLPK